ncbi:MAG TPA: hypothetical protein VKY90_02420 [Candidatus Dormibacteraeota bacterium]|nr:hypothetical protein [Candidatus Dormibacteraeota bacterium]
MTRPTAEAAAAEAATAEAATAEAATAEAATAEAATAEAATAESGATDQVERLEVEVEDVVAELERRYRGRKADDAPELADTAEKTKPSARSRSRR